MRLPEPLPPALLGREFTLSQAAALGVPPHRLRARDVVRIGRGIYRHLGTPLSLESRVRVLCASLPETFACHHTSGILNRLLLPRHIECTPEVHLGRPPDRPAPRRRLVIGHRLALGECELIERDGLRLTSPSRTWLDLAPYLDWADHVALGDQIIRIPRPAFEGRSHPWDTLDGLRRLLESHPNLPGIVAARRTLPYLRVGSDSAPETKFRLALTGAGLPEPELQVLLDPGNPYSYSADLGYRSRRLALQYEGSVHREWPRKLRDNKRDAAFDDARWRTLRFDDSDLANGFVRAVERVRRYLECGVDKVPDTGNRSPGGAQR